MTAASTTRLSLFTEDTGDAVANLLAAARALVPHLNRSRRLDRKLLSSVMTLAFGADDAAGAWSWRDAYDACEAALVLQVRRLAAQVARLEDAPAEICALLSGLDGLCPTQTRRDDEQVALDQFSTPPQIAALCALAGQVRAGDKVLEPSAGTGLLAVLAETCGASLTLNELSPQRAGLLDGLFPSAPRSRHDAIELKDRLSGAGGFDVVVCNPPFGALEAHLHAALDTLADGGRLVAIVPLRLLEAEARLTGLARRGAVVGRIALPARAFAGQGTSVETGLLVVDRGASAPIAPLSSSDDLAQAAAQASALPARASAKPRVFRTPVQPSAYIGRERAAAGPGPRLTLFAETRALDYCVIDWRGEGHDVGLYQAYRLGRIEISGAASHPSPLVESGPMASVAPPVPTYRPVLPTRLLDGACLSDAQLETLVYAGEAHAQTLPGLWRIGTAAHQAFAVGAEAPDAVSFRRGFFLGDGTGCGKGRQIAGIIADNMAQGRLRAVWLSKNDALLEDARRDWGAIGGQDHDIVPQGGWKQGEAISLERGVLFSTYATLRQPARGERPSRLDQVVAWLGADFDGVIVFDEAHAMANAAGGGKGGRGPKKASLQGQAGLALQNRLPNARVLYVSATGATTPDNLAYAGRLGLWGGTEAPFTTREAFLEAVTAGGVAVMELIARELKALGLYIARSLSFDGVEYEALPHVLTPDDILIWDRWADAYQMIHTNLRRALKATGVVDDDGATRSGQAASAVMSAFEGAKLRFFGHLLAGLKAPSLVAAIRADLAAGRSSIVQVVSTNAAVMERRLAQIPAEEWTNLAVDLTPKDQVLDYVMAAFPVQAMSAFESDDGSVTLVPMVQDGRPIYSQEALALRDQLMTELACLPAAPGVLDAVLDAFGPDLVAEVTGRARRIVRRQDRRVVERRGASAARAETDAFMSGKKRVLVFSDAGGTGRSYHADLAAANQQRRVHYLVEPGWRADAAIQGLGRSHRTNQASAPLFRPVTTDIHGEKRFLSTIARRLDSLGALTRGERRTAGAGLFRAEDNLESPFAYRALQAFYVALHHGEVTAMDRPAFETKTGLSLVDRDGNLRACDDLPPMNTFLNRLLALRIADQNALFAAFDAILAGILERAAASGALDRGVEDIVTDELEVLGEETIRTDVMTRAETRLARFSLRTRRNLLSLEDALSGLDPAALLYCVNRKSGRAALAVQGLTTTDDDDRLTPAVRLVRPEKRTTTPLKVFEESAWESVDEATWRAAWRAELATADPFITREIVLVTGLLLPVWSSLPSRQASVRRIKAPDGRRWLGRVLDPLQVPPLKLALGLGDAAQTLGEPRFVLRSVLQEGAALALAGGLWLRRARVMDRWRLEVVGAAAQRQVFVNLGCFVEIIAYTPRVFVPVDKPEVLGAVLGRWPVQSLLPAAA
ncbi:bifunctional class I SAM-dependent methyltransferase/DEAD/DEAH box helicase [Caulobacter sp.]|uniref:bifunctional class I SAM-dependent methyltransferase/DEAD/DEAH box helicase n=1 Tax=Caulobacter sp. TaxID=78 RepID=UPI001B29E118|nr:bifunctional class I SAM-dependent methyltransferase/DEAD/DEAH box helicase [Caulobacter sp.]MBO9547125.1 strawberry notch family protein [Caulobacter sp.]